MTDIGSLNGRVALITGGARGIGFGIAEAFVARGAKVAIADRDGAAVRAAAPTLHESAMALEGDVTNAADSLDWVKEVNDRFGRLDILVNNAGISTNKPFLDQSEEDWDQNIDIIMKGTFLCSKAALPGMVERAHGNVVNVASMAAVAYHNVTHVPYSAAKAGVIVFTRDLAFEMGRHGIRVNCIAPGPIMTDLAVDTLSPEQVEGVRKGTVLGRWGEPSDIGNAAAFLVSDEARFITAVTLPVTGGSEAGGGRPLPEPKS